MLLQGTIAVGMGILIFGALGILVFTPVMSIFSFNAIEWLVIKSSSSITRLTGVRKIVVIGVSVILGIILAFLLISLVFWLLLKDVTFD